MGRLSNPTSLKKTDSPPPPAAISCQCILSRDGVSWARYLATFVVVKFMCLWECLNDSSILNQSSFIKGEFESCWTHMSHFSGDIWFLGNIVSSWFLNTKGLKETHNALDIEKGNNLHSGPDSIDRSHILKKTYVPPLQTPGQKIWL